MLKDICLCFVDLEARERQADTVKTEEVKITRTLEEEVRACWMCVSVCVCVNSTNDFFFLQ